ncbi:MAG: hypothetical protein CMD99_04425 [Gammaproteobacteria bacterium]|nr:hypothetical protein [Gammaproteobacteria bacterium]
MIEQQLFLGALTEQEYRYWLDNSAIKTLIPGETLIGENDFPDIFLVLRGQFAMSRGERSPGIVGLDEFLTGWMTDREWMADLSMALIHLDSGRFGQMLSVEPRRKYLFHASVAPMLAGRLYRDLSDTTEVPVALTRGFERGVRRFHQLRENFLK